MLINTVLVCHKGGTVVIVSTGYYGSASVVVPGPGPGPRGPPPDTFSCVRNTAHTA